MPPEDYEGLVSLIVDLVSYLIPTLFGLLFVFFVWKMISAWVINAADESKRAEGKQYALAAVIALVAMVSVWSIVELILSTFGIV